MEEPGRSEPRRLAILSYHKIGDPPRGAWEPWNYVPETMLAEQLDALREAGWRFVELAAALAGLDEPAGLPPRSALITFDDGYRSLSERGLAVLDGRPAVAFVPTDFIGAAATFDRGVSEPLEPLCGWEQLRELESAGVAVEAHGHRHLPLSSVSSAELEAELGVCKRLLEERLEKTVNAYAFPYGDPGAQAAVVSALLRRLGYRAACLYGGGAIALPAADPYGLDRLAVGYDTDLLAELAAAEESALRDGSQA